VGADLPLPLSLRLPLHLCWMNKGDEEFLCGLSARKEKSHTGKTDVAQIF
jgi:hypothetical protein